MPLFPVEKMNLTTAAATAKATATAGDATGIITNSTANATAAAAAAATTTTTTTTTATTAATATAITTTITTTTRTTTATVTAPETANAIRKLKACDITMQAIYKLQIHVVCVTFSSTGPQVATATISMAQRRTVGTRSGNNRCLNRSWTILNNEQRTSHLNGCEVNGWSKQRSTTE